MVHTEKSLRAQDGNFENYHYCLGDGEKYALSRDELIWLDYVRGKYAIAKHIQNNLEFDVYTMDVEGLSKALAADGCMYHAPCLSDDSVLQQIIFYSSEVEYFTTYPF